MTARNYQQKLDLSRFGGGADSDEDDAPTPVRLSLCLCSPFLSQGVETHTCPP